MCNLVTYCLQWNKCVIPAIFATSTHSFHKIAVIIYYRGYCAFISLQTICDKIAHILRLDMSWFCRYRGYCAFISLQTICDKITGVFKLDIGWFRRNCGYCCVVFSIHQKTLQSTCSLDLRDVELKNSKSFELRPGGPINAIKYMATPSPNCQIWKTSFLNVSANFKFSKFWGQQYLTFDKYDRHIMFIGMFR